MPYTVLVEEPINIISVKYVGGIGIKERMEVVELVCGLEGAGENKKSLIDITEINNKMTVDESMCFGKYLAERKELKITKVAAVNKNETNNSNVIIYATDHLHGYSSAPFNSRRDACVCG